MAAYRQPWLKKSTHLCLYGICPAELLKVLAWRADASDKGRVVKNINTLSTSSLPAGQEGVLGTSDLSEFDKITQSFICYHGAIQSELTAQEIVYFYDKGSRK